MKPSPRAPSKLSATTGEKLSPKSKVQCPKVRPRVRDFGHWTLDFGLVSDSYFNPAVLNNYFVSFNRASVGYALAGANIEAPAVPVALDGVAAEMSVGERRSLVRTKILDGVKLSVYVVERQFRAVLELDGCAATGRHIFYSTDGGDLPFTLRLSKIPELWIKRLHEENRSK